MKFKLLFLFLLIPMLFACGDEIDSNMSETMVDFEFTAQDESMLGLEDLKGDWWVANFIYTNCRAVCPRTTANLVGIQQELEAINLHPQIISFSIDPDFDTPDVLHTYANDYGANLDSWSFLTGYEFEHIQEIAQNTFKFPLSVGALDQRAHGYNFYLIDPEGEIVKEYNGMSDEDLQILVDDLEHVL